MSARLAVVFERSFQRRLSAQTHEEQVDRNAVQPSGESRIAAKGADLAVDHQKCFLSEIFSFGRISDHAQAQRVNARAMQMVKALKCGGVFELSTRYGFLLRHRGRAGSIAFQVAGVFREFSL